MRKVKQRNSAAAVAIPKRLAIPGLLYGGQIAKVGQKLFFSTLDYGSRAVKKNWTGHHRCRLVDDDDATYWPLRPPEGADSGPLFRSWPAPVLALKSSVHCRNGRCRPQSSDIVDRLLPSRRGGFGPAEIRLAHRTIRFSLLEQQHVIGQHNNSFNNDLFCVCLLCVCVCPASRIFLLLLLLLCSVVVE